MSEWTLTCPVCDRAWNVSAERMPEPSPAPMHREGSAGADRCRGTGRVRVVQLPAAPPVTTSDTHRDTTGMT